MADFSILTDAHCHWRPKSDAIVSVRCSAVPDDWSEILESGGPKVRVMIGLHPWYVTADDSRLEELNLLLQDSSAGIGEIGLDRTGRGISLDEQADLFRRQLMLASEYERPAAVHCVRAWGRLLEILKEDSFRQNRWMIHGYNGSLEIAAEILKLGGFISLNPLQLKPGKLAGLLEIIPPGQLLIETDYEGRSSGEYRTFLERNYHHVSVLLNMTIPDLADRMLLNLNRLWHKGD